MSIRVTGEGDGPVRVVVGGPLRVGPRRARRVASALAASGTRLEVRDGRGRALAVAGPGVRSPIGRALLGTARVRPTARGLAAAMGRSAASPVPDHHGGSR